MAIDPVGAALGSASLFFVLYDTCDRLYQGCQKMRYFGRDLLQERMIISCLMSNLSVIMDTKTTDMREPPDLNNPDHHVTREITNHLRIISTYFKACHDIIQNALKNAGYLAPTLETIISASSHSGETGSSKSIKSGPSQSSAATGTTSGTGKSKMHLKLPSLFHRRSSSKKRERNLDSAQSQPSEQSSTNTSQTAISSVQSAPSSTSGLRGQVVQAISKDDPESQRARAEASWYTLFKWSDHDRLKLRSGVQDLRTAIHDFRDYIELRRPANPGAVLALEASASEDDYVPNLDPVTLKKIHEALKRINTSSATGPHILSVSIANSCLDNRDVLGAFPGMSDKLRRESLVTFLQKHDDPASTFLAIESGSEPFLLPHIGILNDLSSVKPPKLADLQNEDRYMRCGSVIAQPGDEYSHEVFMEVQQWNPVKSLSECLDDPGSAALLSIEVILRLFRSILLAYLDFGMLRSSCRYPRLEDYRTYQCPVYTNDHILTQEASNQPWENPYWACGLGMSVPARIPGASRQTFAPDEPVVRLGLVLFQLASRSKRIMAVAAGESERNWRRLQSEALRALHDVQAVCGIAIGAVVEACLLSNAQTERKTLCECLVKLNKIEEEL